MRAACRLALVLVPALVLTGCTPKGTPEPIVLGHLAPLSGPDKAAGEQAVHGIDLAVDEVNREGNRINNRPVNVVHKDIAGGVDAVRAQTVELIKIRQPVALLGGLDAAQLEQISRADDPYGLPLVSPAAGAGPPPGDSVFSTAVTPAYQGQVLARFTREVLKPPGVLVLADDRSTVATALAAAFVPEAGQGNTVKVEQATYRAEADFAGLVSRVKKDRPKAVLLAGPAGDLVKLATQLHEADPDAALLLGAEEGSVPTLAAGLAGVGPAYAASVFAADALTPKGQEAAKQYRERFGEDLDARAALAYDDTRMLFEGLRRARRPAGSEVRKELAGLENFEGVNGPVSFTKEHTARRAVFVLRLQGGKAQVAKRYDPEGK